MHKNATKSFLKVNYICNIKTLQHPAVSAMEFHRTLGMYGGGDAGDDGSEFPSFCSWFRLI